MLVSELIFFFFDFPDFLGLFLIWVGGCIFVCGDQVFVYLYYVMVYQIKLYQTLLY